MDRQSVRSERLILKTVSLSSPIIKRKGRIRLAVNSMEKIANSANLMDTYAELFALYHKEKTTRDIIVEIRAYRIQLFEFGDCQFLSFYQWLLS